MKEFLQLMADNWVSVVLGISTIVLFAFVIVYVSKKYTVEMSGTRLIAFVGVFSALSYAFMFFGFSIVPAAPYLKLEFSVVIILLALLFFDLKAAVLISLVTNVVDYLIKNSETGIPIDQTANFLATVVILIVFAVSFSKYGQHIEDTKKNNVVSILTSLVAVAAVTVVMVFLNWIWITPFYAELGGYSEFLPSPLLPYIIGLYGPFNIIKWGLVSLVFSLIRIRLNPNMFQN